MSSVSEPVVEYGIETLESNKFHFFWNGELSQWYPSTFMYQLTVFNCAEQAMMAHKALTFNAMDVYQKIMRAKHPSDQKKLGRSIFNFDEATWDKVKRRLVFEINMAKFTQSQELKKYLFSTKGKRLVEASPLDPIWGVGLAENDPLILDEKNWKGQNLLGETLTLVRDVLMFTNPLELD